MYTDEQKSLFKLTAEKTVNNLIEVGLNAKVGSKNGLAYPSVRMGKWTLALQWDDGFGWSCPAYEIKKNPHWHWFLTPNLENFKVSYATGMSAKLFAFPHNSVYISGVMRFVAGDPCRIPYSHCTPKFMCPECSDSWDITQNDESVFGRFMSPLKKMEVTPNSTALEGWDTNAVSIVFDPFD